MKHQAARPYFFKNGTAWCFHFALFATKTSLWSEFLFLPDKLFFANIFRSLILVGVKHIFEPFAEPPNRKGKTQKLPICPIP
jgi:hypothetical protein